MTCNNCSNHAATVMVAGGFLCLCGFDNQYHRQYDTCPFDSDEATKKRVNILKHGKPFTDEDIEKLSRLPL